MLSKAARRVLSPSMTCVSPRVIQGDIVIVTMSRAHPRYFYVDRLAKKNRASWGQSNDGRSLVAVEELWSPPTAALDDSIYPPRQGEKTERWRQILWEVANQSCGPKMVGSHFDIVILKYFE